MIDPTFVLGLAIERTNPSRVSTLSQARRGAVDEIRLPSTVSAQKSTEEKKISTSP